VSQHKRLPSGPALSPLQTADRNRLDTPSRPAAGKIRQQATSEVARSNRIGCTVQRSDAAMSAIALTIMGGSSLEGLKPCRLANETLRSLPTRPRCVRVKGGAFQRRRCR